MTKEILMNPHLLEGLEKKSVTDLMAMDKEDLVSIIISIYFSKGVFMGKLKRGINQYNCGGR